MKITLKKNLCLGCGVCVALCPQFFEMDKEGKSSLKGAKLDPQTNIETLTIDQIDCITGENDRYIVTAIKDAADSCPGQAIVVE